MTRIVHGYERLMAFAISLQSPLLLVLRLVWGGFFVKSGVVKLTHIEEVIEAFADWGIAFPVFNAWLVGWVHLVGGLCLVVGLLSRLAALPLAITMVVAYAAAYPETVMQMVYLYDPAPFIFAEPFLFLVATLMVIAFGPGRYSLDALGEKPVASVRGVL